MIYRYSPIYGMDILKKLSKIEIRHLSDLSCIMGRLSLTFGVTASHSLRLPHYHGLPKRQYP
jgi:hypothetical protein